MVVYIYYLTTAGNSLSSQLGSSCQGNRNGTENAGGMARPSHTKSHLPGHSSTARQAGRRIVPALLLPASLPTTDHCIKALVKCTLAVPGCKNAWTGRVCRPVG